MEQVSEKLNYFASSEAGKSLVDDDDRPVSDDKEYTTSGFYVREKPTDKESATNSSSNSNDGTKDDDNQTESVTDVALVNGETSEKMAIEEEVIEEDNKNETEEVIENSDEAETDVIDESNKDVTEDNNEDKIETDKEDIVEKSDDEVETKEKSDATEVINEVSDNNEAKIESVNDEIDKDKNEEKKIENNQIAEKKDKIETAEKVVDELEETTTNNISSTEEETILEATVQNETESATTDKKSDEEKSSKDEETKEATVEDEPMPLEEEKTEDKEINASDENKSQETPTTDKKKDEDATYSKHSSSTNTGTDYEDEDDFDPSLLCPDISMDVDEAAPVVTNSQPPSAPRDSSLSPLPYEPIFSTLVDEYTGTEIQVDLTPEEMELRQNMYKISNPVQSTKIHCTACNVHLGSALTGANNRFVHPLLKVLICKNCYHFYTSGEFEKDEDGSELYCRWCGQGGQVLCCSSCEFVFCKRCIRNNFGPKKFKQIRESDDWSCFRCDPGQLSYLRAACAEFIDYYKKESQRVHALAGANPELMTTDYTKCCSKEKVEEGKPPGQRAKRRRNNNEDSDPDYNVHESAEPSAKRQHLSAAATASTNQLRTLAPKPSTATSIVAPSRQAIRPQVGSKIDPVRFRPMGNSQIRGVPPGFVAKPGTPGVSPNFVKLVPQQRLARPMAPSQQVRPLSYTVVSGTTNGRPTLSTIRPAAKPANQIPPMKHEWFEKTVRAAARVNSNLSYTLTQLNRQQSQANSVESLAVVHNKLQEVLSTSINSLIQVRKNLRAEFLVGIKSVKLPPKTPKPVTAPAPAPPPAPIPDDDDVIFVSQPPPLVMSPSVTIANKKIPLKIGVNNNVNKTLTVRSGVGAKPIPSTSGVKPTTPTTNLAKLASNKIAVKPGGVKSTPPTPAASIGGPVKGGGFLKVRSLMALQSVPSECITIPDDPVEDPLKLSSPLLPMLPMPHANDNRIEILDDESEKNESPMIIMSSPPPLAKLSRPSPVPEMEMTFNLSKPLSPKVRKMMRAHVPIDKSPYLEQLLEKTSVKTVKIEDKGKGSRSTS
ncbi:unnamed protein product [Ceutorhynchus assimilis]|uniref:PHD-type domain-containing protein n=1 Tax=Ceutorhynchus assimilis TaxID=467358 RepID=A0A9N9MLH8_9CUCU|nr:unnamed protein product [Ceutorhynchus assimilis]